MQKIKHDILWQFVSYRSPPILLKPLLCDITVLRWHGSILVYKKHFIKNFLCSAKEYELY